MHFINCLSSCNRPEDQMVRAEAVDGGGTCVK